MADVGLNSNLTLDHRQFHIQTSTNIEEGYIRSEIFEQGRLLYLERYDYERRHQKDAKLLEKRIQQLTDYFHRTILEELEALFFISERVHQDGDPRSHERLGLIFLYLHIFDKAEEHLQKAAAVEDHLYSSSVYLARTYFMQRKYQQAATTLAKLLGKNVPYPDFYNMFGLIALERKQFLQALQYLKQALRLNADYLEAHINLIRVLLRRVQLLRATSHREDVEKVVHFLKIIVQKLQKLATGDVLEFSKKLGDMIGRSMLNKAVGYADDFYEERFIRRFPPELIGYQFYLFLRYYSDEITFDLLQRFEDRMQTAVENSPDYPDLWYYLGLIHLMQCRYYFLQGKDYFNEATRINPNFEKASKNRRIIENDSREFLALIKAIV